MRHQPVKYRPFKKPVFYCDENFPAPSLVKLENFKVIHSVIDLNHRSRDDYFHYQYAASRKAVLLTLDGDYLNNRKFKISQTYGVIVLTVGQSPTSDRVDQVISKLMPLLKSLDELSLKSIKISASLEGYTKLELKNNRIEKGEFNWRNINLVQSN